MVKSVVHAMDAIQAVTREKYRQEVSGFVLTGGSKRGWTTYLTGAVDARVVAMAPMVFDVLDMKSQMVHQMKVYGAYSEMIHDYTERGIQSRLDSPEADRLLEIVDPFAFRDEMTMPKLVLLGTNDPYWCVDSANLYFPQLEPPKYLHYEANAGHGLGVASVTSLTAFYHDVLTGTPMPEMTWSRNKDGMLEVAWDRADGKARLWRATSPNRDFRNAFWSSQDLDGDRRCTANVAPPADGWLAYYVEVTFPNELGFALGLSTTMTVLPDTFPEHGTAEAGQEPAE